MPIFELSSRLLDALSEQFPRIIRLYFSASALTPDRTQDSEKVKGQ
jgi:hypothetical protein